MKLRLRVYFPFVAVLSVPAGVWSQSQEIPSNGAQNPRASVVSKPTRKPDQVITNDSIALLAVPHAPAAIVPPAVEDAEGVTKERSPGVDEGARKTTDIASVEQQIKEKQKRIALLMRLFVDDERAFLIDPGNMKVDAAVAERRRYEQDELRWETAQLARLTERLKELTSSR